MRALLCVMVLAMNDYVYFLSAVRPEMVTAPTEREMKILGEHGAYLDRLTKEGTILVAGRTQDTPPIGLAIFRAESDEAANAIMKADPAVANGIMTAKLHPFRAAFVASPKP